ncbi:MAG: N-acetylmuramic acid 6-phosphate etherase, partial [Sulfobacillus sp.]
MYDTHGLTTESGQQKYGALDTFTSLEIVQALNQEDQTVAARVAQALPVIARVVDEVARSLAEGGRLIYVGAGTSGRLGVLDAAECPPTFGVDYDTIIAVIAGGDKAVRQAVEDAEDDAQKGRADVQNLDLRPKDCLLGISASGRTPYVLGALHEARGQGLLTVALSNNLNSKIGKVADIAIEIETGPEV